MNGSIEIFTWHQDVHVAVAEQFCKELEKFVNTDAKMFILDLHDLNYVNSVALGAIANAALTSRKAGKKLVIAGVSGTLEDIFNIVKFSSFIPLFRTVEEAKAHLLSGRNSRP